MKLFNCLIIVFAVLSSCSSNDDLNPCFPDGITEGDIYNEFIYQNGEFVCPEETHYLIGPKPGAEACLIPYESACFPKDYSQYPERGTITYKLYSDCPCNSLFEPFDSILLQVAYGSSGLLAAYMTPARRSAGSHPLGDPSRNPVNGYYRVDPEGGDRFYFRNILDIGSNTSCRAYPDHPKRPLSGFVSGKFNEDDTYCESTFYWQYYEESIEDWVIVDSCNWVLRR